MVYIFKLEHEAEQLRKEDLELRLSGGGSPESQESSESISREEKLLEEMLRLKLTMSSSPFIIIIKLLNNSVVPDEQLVEVECSSGWERKCDAAS